MMVREYEENRRMMIEQQAVLENMPAKEGFGYDPASLSLPSASSSKAKASSPLVSVTSEKGKAKRRKTPEYTDSEEESN